MARVFLTRKHEAWLWGRMNALLTTNADGTVSYATGHSDASLLEELRKEFDVPFNSKHVADYRLDVFGKLAAYPIQAASMEDRINNRLKELGDAIDNLKLWAAARPREPFKL